MIWKRSTIQTEKRSRPEKTWKMLTVVKVMAAEVGVVKLRVMGVRRLRTSMIQMRNRIMGIMRMIREMTLTTRGMVGTETRIWDPKMVRRSGMMTGPQTGMHPYDKHPYDVALWM
jgi:hypothetical protein